jgi:hypothetical protein
MPQRLGRPFRGKNRNVFETKGDFYATTNPDDSDSGGNVQARGRSNRFWRQRAGTRTE